jgi:hypothetical protein
VHPWTQELAHDLNQDVKGEGKFVESLEKGVSSLLCKVRLSLPLSVMMVSV